MDLIRTGFELALIAIVGIYMATCLVAVPLACFAAAYRRRQRALDLEYSQTYYTIVATRQPRRISS